MKATAPCKLEIFLLFCCELFVGRHNHFPYFHHIQKAMHNSPKMWHLYVKMSLQKCLEKEKHTLKTLSMWREKPRKTLFSFLLQSKSSSGKWRQDNSSVMKQLSGRFNINALDICDLKQTNNITIHWTFKLEESFSLNVTFVEVNIAEPSLNCSHLYFAIGRSTRDLHGFRFCGEYSAFTFYSPYRNTILKLFSHFSCQRYYILSTFQVFDKHVATNVHSDHFTGRFLLVSTTGYEEILSFWMKVEESFFVKVKSSFVEQIVVDGPEFECDNVFPHKQFYSCSTFQCIVVVASQEVNFGQIVFFGQPLENSHKIMLSQETTTAAVNVSLTISNVEHILVFAPYPKHINVTIAEIVYKGKQSDSCKYGGIFTFSKLKNFTRNSPTLCQNHSSALHFSRSFYSSNSSLSVVVFGYTKELSHTKAMILLQVTDCKAVFFCSCKMTSPGELPHLCYQNPKEKTFPEFDLHPHPAKGHTRGDAITTNFADGYTCHVIHLLSFHMRTRIPKRPNYHSSYYDPYEAYFTPKLDSGSKMEVGHFGNYHCKTLYAFRICMSNYQHCQMWTELKGAKFCISKSQETDLLFISCFRK